MDKTITDAGEGFKKNRRHTVMTTLEEMKGYITVDATDFQKGYLQGREKNTYIVVHFEVIADDVENFVTRPDHQGHLKGYIRCNQLWGKERTYEGTINLFTATDNPWLKKLFYRLYFKDEQENQLTFYGIKELSDYPFSSVLKDTQILYTKILKGWVKPGEEESAPVFATGILFLYIRNFITYVVFN
ncbi:MAG: hypothetical protein ACRDEB_03010, partial [Chitinophagaceae bacterium]